MSSPPMNSLSTYIKVPLLHVRPAGIASHIAERHVGWSLASAARRKATGFKIGKNGAVTSFPSEAQLHAALAGRPTPGNQPGKFFYECDQFCSWGVKGHQDAFRKLIAERPEPSTWQLADLNRRNIDFFISKDVVYCGGGNEVTAFGIPSTRPDAMLLNKEALAHLNVNDLQAAVKPECPGWRGVKAAKKFDIVNHNGEELMLSKGGTAAKVVKYGLLLVAVVVETAFFVAEWEAAESKAAHVVNYACQLGLIAGGAVAAEATATAVVAAGGSAVAAGCASFGVGVLFVAAGIGVKLLIKWIVRLTRPPTSRCDVSLYVYDMVPMMADDVFVDDVILCEDVVGVTETCCVANDIELMDDCVFPHFDD